MANNDVFFWCIRAGATGDAEKLFLEQNHIAVGWPKVGELSSIVKDKDKLKKRIAEVYPDKKPGAIPGDAGMLIRFTSEMKHGDWVLYPSKKDKRIHIGKISGDYTYAPDTNAVYPNQRSVVWQASFPRTRFSQGALYELGAISTLFQVKNYADEFVLAINGKAAPEEPFLETDPTLALVAEEIEQNTRDFVLKQLAKELKGHPLEDFVAHLLQTMGYRTRVSAVGADGGVDIIAHRDELGFEPPIVKVQVKSTEGSIGDPLVSALYGKVSRNEFGLLVTLGSFTSQAQHFAREKSNLRLIDGVELVDLFLQHYEQFDARYKGLIPLKRVYVPEPLQEVDE